MSRAAQEMQRIADEAKKNKKRWHLREVPKPQHAEPEAHVDEEFKADEPQGEQPEGAGGSESGVPSTETPSTETAAEAGDTTMAAAKNSRKRAAKNGKKSAKAAAPKTVKAPKVKAAKAEAVKDPMAGIREKPKNNILFINRAPALALVKRLLKDATDLSKDEQYEADRLLARIKARE